MLLPFKRQSGIGSGVCEVGKRSLSPYHYMLGLLDTDSQAKLRSNTPVLLHCALHAIPATGVLYGSSAVQSVQLSGDREVEGKSGGGGRSWS